MSPSRFSLPTRRRVVLWSAAVQSFFALLPLIVLMLAEPRIGFIEDLKAWTALAVFGGLGLLATAWLTERDLVHSVVASPYRLWLERLLAFVGDVIVGGLLWWATATLVLLAVTAVLDPTHMPAMGFALPVGASAAPMGMGVRLAWSSLRLGGESLEELRLSLSHALALFGGACLGALGAAPILVVSMLLQMEV